MNWDSKWQKYRSSTPSAPRVASARLARLARGDLLDAKRGRQSTFISGELQRYSEKNGGDDKIIFAATESARKQAMTFLAGFA